MAFGKILGFAALGVGAVALAPFTGGGSVAGAFTLAASLEGAALAVGGAAALGGAIGAASAIKEEEENAERRKFDKEKDEKLAEQAKKIEKFEEKLKELLKRFRGDKEYFNYIIAMTAMGISMANSDGEIDPAETQELEEFIGGIASSNYPKHIKREIDKLYKNPPTFNRALKYLKKVNYSNHESIKEMLELIMEADGDIHPKEKAFLEAFNRKIQHIKYLPEKNDIQDNFLLKIRENI